ncbi:MAG TPA: prolyl oligopeptidase family serine peptidase [Phycisphaerae bacterium]|nr:prolyl oligopeptidase family serine peptidase [Phycisphaerae bacterium]
MRYRTAMVIVALSAGVSGCGRVSTTRTPALVYPQTRTVDVVDDYHGIKVPDPYRWLEDLDSPEVQAWVEAQNRVTFAYLESIPARTAIRERLTQLQDYERFDVPTVTAGRYFFLRNSGLQNQSVLYVADGLDGQPRVLLDPNTLSPDGTVALAGTDVTADGKLLAYAIARAGSDWNELYVRDVQTGQDLPDHINWVKFSAISWTHDGSGFFYSRYDEPDDKKLQSSNYYQKLYFHRLGTPQSDDRLVYDRPDRKEWMFTGQVTDDGRYLIIYVSEGTEPKNRVYYLDLRQDRAEVVRLLDEFDAEYAFIDNDGPIFWFRTDLDAPRRRVVAIDIRNPRRDHWKELIPQAPETLDSVSVVDDVFLASYLKDACSQVKVFDLGGRFVREVTLPGIGNTWGFDGKRTDRETFYGFTGYTTPGTIYRYVVKTGESIVYKKPKVRFNPDDYQTRQVFYSSKDGTRVPMFITHRKGLKLDGDAPTLLYGYGGFSIPNLPRFAITRVAWMEMGGVYAEACIRGGGEYGEDWHNAGRLKNKQKCFDDFIAAAEWLIANNYTRPARLAIHGGSNGGLLVAACMTQRPELFGAVLPAVGVLDMLRFSQYTIGWAWTSEYGRPDDPEMFPVLRAYSPLHNLKPGTHYPATLLTTADHDDRVVPSHSFKFAAALQAAQAGPAPVLIRIETRAGHGAGKPTSKRIEEAADQLAFLVRVLDMRLPPKRPG